MRYKLLGLAMLMLLAPAGAQADECTVSATAVAFGVYNPFSASPLDTTGTVTVHCFGFLFENANYTIRFSTGGGAGYARRMSSGSALLSYQLYRNAARTEIWGDGSGGTFTIAVNQNYTAEIYINHTVYGRIPASQTTVSPGSYTDTITVTVTYF